MNEIEKHLESHDCAFIDEDGKLHVYIMASSTGSLTDDYRPERLEASFEFVGDYSSIESIIDDNPEKVTAVIEDLTEQLSDLRSGVTFQTRRYNPDTGETTADEDSTIMTVGEALPLIDNAGDWFDDVKDGFTAMDLLASLAWYLDLDVKDYETAEDLQDAIEEEFTRCKSEPVDTKRIWYLRDSYPGDEHLRFYSTQKEALIAGTVIWERKNGFQQDRYRKNATGEYALTVGYIDVPASMSEDEYWDAVLDQEYGKEIADLVE